MDILQKTFSIKLKVAIMLLFNVIILVFFIYIISVTIISKSYLSIEKKAVVQDIQRVNDAIENRYVQLTVKLTDWASWDDSYQFMQDKNKDYIKSNIQNTSLSNLKINAMVFVDIRNVIFFNKIVDFTNNQEISLESLISHIKFNNKLTIHEDTDNTVAGIIMLPEGPFLISSKPILTTNNEGPIRGSLIFGKFLDDSIVNEIEELTYFSIKLYDLNSFSLPEDVLFAKTQLLNGEVYVVNPISKDQIAGYKILNDIYGKPVLISKVDLPRPVYNQGLFTIKFFIITASILIILFGISIVFLLQRLVISRLVVLDKEVEKISTTGDLSFRVKEGVRDEVGTLAVTINQMLEALHIAKTNEQKATENIKTVSVDLQKHLQQTEKMNGLMVSRELKMIELKKEIEELKSKLQ